jgi:hypothetical protein
MDYQAYYKRQMGTKEPSTKIQLDATTRQMGTTNIFKRENKCKCPRWVIKPTIKGK